MPPGPTSVVVSDLDSAGHLYSRALQPLDYHLLDQTGSSLGFGLDEVDLWVHHSNGSPVRPKHIVLPCDSRAAVRSFFSSAARLGARLESSPAFRKQQTEFAAAIIDFDGNKIEALFVDDYKQALPTAPVAPSPQLNSASVAVPERQQQQQPLRQTARSLTYPQPSSYSSPSQHQQQQGQFLQDYHHPIQASARKISEHTPGIIQTIMSNCNSFFSPTADPPPANNDGDVRESDPRTLVGTLVGAAAGAALTYVWCKSSQSSQKEAEWQEAIETNRDAQIQANQLHAQTNQILAASLQQGQLPHPHQHQHALQHGQIMAGQTQMSLAMHGANQHALSHHQHHQAQGQVVPMISPPTSAASSYYNCPSSSLSVSSAGTANQQQVHGMRMIEPAPSNYGAPTRSNSYPYASVETVCMSSDDLITSSRRGSYQSSTSGREGPMYLPAPGSSTARPETVYSSSRHMSQMDMSDMASNPSQHHSRVDSMMQPQKAPSQHYPRSDVTSSRGGYPKSEVIVDNLSETDSIGPDDSISNVGSRHSTTISTRSKARTSHSRHSESRKSTRSAATGRTSGRRGADFHVQDLDALPEEEEEDMEGSRRSHTSKGKSSKSGPKSTATRTTKAKSSAPEAEPGAGSLFSGITGMRTGKKSSAGNEENMPAPSAVSRKTSKSTRTAKTAVSSSSKARYTEEPEVYALPDDYPVPVSSRSAAPTSASRRTKAPSTAAPSSSGRSRRTSAEPELDSGRSTVSANNLAKLNKVSAGSRAGSSVSQWCSGVPGDREMAVLGEAVRTGMKI